MNMATKTKSDERMDRMENMLALMAQKLDHPAIVQPPPVQPVEVQPPPRRNFLADVFSPPGRQLPEQKVPEKKEEPMPKAEKLRHVSALLDGADMLNFLCFCIGLFLGLAASMFIVLVMRL